MSLRDTATAWLSAWKWVLLLLVLLIASVWLNLVQWRDKAVAKSEARAETLADVNRANTIIARENVKDGRELIREIAIVAERGRKERVVYRTVAAPRPLPQGCAPGQPRMDAVNAGADE